MAGLRRSAWRSAVEPVPRSDPAHRRGAGHRAVAWPAEPARLAADPLVQWCQRGGRPLWLVEGAALAGKTTLLAEAADRLARRRWRCGWARHGRAADAVRAAARYRRRTLVLIDDADTRGELTELVRVLANGGRPLPVRVVVAARTFDGWWDGLLDRLDPSERAALGAGRTVVGPPPMAGHPADDQDATGGEVVDGAGAANGTASLAAADRGSAVVLLRLAALIVALPTRVGGLGPAEIRAAVWDLLAGKGYWRRITAQVSPPSEPAPALRAALACVAAVGPDGLGDAATVLRRVPALATGAADRLARLVLRWRELAVGSVNGAGGEHRATDVNGTAETVPDGLANVPADPSALSWTAAALAAERYGTGMLARLTLAAHRDVWCHGDPRPGAAPARAVPVPAPGAPPAPVDEALAWLAGELDLRPADLRSLGEAITHPAWSLHRTAVALARRLLPVAGTDEDRAALWFALSARLSELGRWEEARQAAEEAVGWYRELAREHPDRYRSELAAAEHTLRGCATVSPAPARADGGPAGLDPAGP